MVKPELHYPSQLATTDPSSLVETAIRIGGTDEIPEDSREKFIEAVSDCRGS
jgi:hypothetical protein